MGFYSLHRHELSIAEKERPMTHLRLTSLWLSLRLIAQVSAAAAETPTRMEECREASDCLPAPEVYPDCFVYCQAKECDQAHQCPVINRFFKNFPNCAKRVLCRRVTTRIACLDGLCSAASKPADSVPH